MNYDYTKDVVVFFDGPYKYFLYKDEEKYYLSMIAPWEWKKECIGEFKFDHNGKWNKI